MSVERLVESLLEARRAGRLLAALIPTAVEQLEECLALLDADPRVDLGSRGLAWLRHLSPDDVTPTQAELDEGLTRILTRVVDLPPGLGLLVAGRTWLFDGHHRLEARRRRRELSPTWVVDAREFESF